MSKITVLLADTRGFIDKYIVGVNPLEFLKYIVGTVGGCYVFLLTQNLPQWVIRPVLVMVGIVAVINFLKIPKSAATLAADPNIIREQEIARAVSAIPDPPAPETETKEETP